MRYTILLLTLCLFTLQSYANGKLTKRYTIQQLQELTAVQDDAILMDYNDFFQRRMQNYRYYKMDGRACEILFETDNYVYYGYPFHTPDKQMEMRKTKGKITYYKVDKKELQKHFPVYKTVQGYQLKDVIFASDKTLHPPLESYWNIGFSSSLSGKYIIIGVNYKRQQQVAPVNPRFITYYTYVDMYTLQVKPMP